MFGPNTILQVYLAPKDSYSFNQFKAWHKVTKRRWKTADILGADEVKVLENNRRHFTKYKRSLKIFGWISTNVKYEKSESHYQDVVGDPYFDYFKKFAGYILDWWGVGGKFTKKRKKERNITSVPNTPMLDVSIHFDNNSFMEKLYLQGMTYDEAVSQTFKGKSSNSDLITKLSEYNRNVEGMNEEEAYREAMRVTEIVHRNIALDKNSPTTNEYNFMVNYFNKFIDSRMREMMKIDINFHFLKEAMRYNPNLTFYVLGPYNRLMKIQGIVGERCKNIIVMMETQTNTSKYKHEITYSVSSETLLLENEKGWITAKDFPKNKGKLKNMMHGNRPCYVDRRFNTEYMYDLILEGEKTGDYMPYFDAHHNCFLGKDYSKKDNLNGKDIIC